MANREPTPNLFGRATTMDLHDLFPSVRSTMDGLCLPLFEDMEPDFPEIKFAMPLAEGENSEQIVSEFAAYDSDSGVEAGLTYQSGIVTITPS
jgi:hypothetical protein